MKRTIPLVLETTRQQMCICHITRTKARTGGPRSRTPDYNALSPRSNTKYKTPSTINLLSNTHNSVTMRSLVDMTY